MQQNTIGRIVKKHPLIAKIQVLSLLAWLCIGATVFGTDAFPETGSELAQGIVASDEAEMSPTIVLLQGMGRGRASLWVLDTRLRQAGYRVVSFPYSAHRKSIDGHAEDLVAFIGEHVKDTRYHLIAHSLGNLIVRTAFREGLPPGLDRVVMLAPPNRAADLARALRDNKVYQWFTGESGQLLGSEAFYAQLPVPAVEFGIIAGDRGQSFIFQEANDGVISVENTKLNGMKDWIVVHQSHNFIMNSRVVAALCVSFLQNGVFDRGLVNPDETLPEDPPEGVEAPKEPSE